VPDAAWIEICSRPPCAPLRHWRSFRKNNGALKSVIGFSYSAFDNGAKSVCAISAPLKKANGATHDGLFEVSNRRPLTGFLVVGLS
jgi:hypothetical protein